MEKINTQDELFKHCKQIAEQIQLGEYETDDDEPCNAYDYLSDSLDIEYTVSSDGRYLGARILVAFGGPNIWINTRTMAVEGYWWSDKAVADYSEDALGLDEAAEEIWNCRFLYREKLLSFRG